MLTKRCGFHIIVSAKAHKVQRHKVYTKIEKVIKKEAMQSGK